MIVLPDSVAIGMTVAWTLLTSVLVIRPVITSVHEHDSSPIWSLVGGTTMIGFAGWIMYCLFYGRLSFTGRTWRLRHRLAQIPDAHRHVCQMLAVSLNDNNNDGRTDAELDTDGGPTTSSKPTAKPRKDRSTTQLEKDDEQKMQKRSHIANQQITALVMNNLQLYPANESVPLVRAFQEWSLHLGIWSEAANQTTELLAADPTHRLAEEWRTIHTRAQQEHKHVQTSLMMMREHAALFADQWVMHHSATTAQSAKQTADNTRDMAFYSQLSYWNSRPHRI
jgi:hypothetical protein